MRQWACATVLFATLVVGGCQTISTEEAALCSEIARFANSASDSTTHVVDLSTDWGGHFAEKKPNEIVLLQKRCDDYGYAPGARLCGYLLQNTSTEFPDANVNSVMVCLGAARPTKMVYDLDYGKTVLWSHVTRGANPNIVVGIDYSVGTDAAPPSLKIMARMEH
jgi:hypothetical protein